MSTAISVYQRLKYRRLPAFIDRQLHIPTFHSIQDVLLKEMASALPAQFVLQSEPDWMAGVMAKYGMLDLTFSAPVSVLTAADSISWDALNHLGLAESEGHLDEEFGWVEKNIYQDQCFLRVFLTCYLPAEAMQLRDEQARIAMSRGAPAREASSAALDYLTANITQRFPLTATIDDACLTNSPSIWVNAHFYM